MLSSTFGGILNLDANRLLAKVGTLERDLAELKRLIIDQSPLPEIDLNAYRLLEGAAEAGRQGKPVQSGTDWEAFVLAAGYPHAGYTGGFFSHAGRSLEWESKAGWLVVSVTPKGFGNLTWYQQKLIKSGQLEHTAVARRVDGEWKLIHPLTKQVMTR